jgi:hypothetical protein
MRFGSSGLDGFENKFTAYEMKANRDEARLVGIADVIRLLDGDDGAVSYATNKIITRWPEAYKFVPVGSRPGEKKPVDMGHFEFRDGEVLYWRPGNTYMADSCWLVPR